MNSDSDLYGDDIRLWSERQGALLRRLSAGEAVSDRVDWQHVVGEIEDLGHDYAQRAAHDEIARLTARLAAAEAEVNELRARLEALTGKLTDTQVELATTQDQVETATARAVGGGRIRASHAAGQRRAEGQGPSGAAQGGVARGIAKCRPLMTCDGFFGAPRGGRGRYCGAFGGGSGR
jgi:uncharacterized coiled-coil protein SlyX